ncbi:MAG: single-stranded-DNA-specific exonuclease RecJ [Chloroflexi bacterium]|nr:single-stranded-DNA-specific exonuclease RecJ [Chloroflexota bacterium]
MTARNPKQWHDPSSITPGADLAAHVGGHPLVAQILAQRGIRTIDAAQAFLSADAYTPAPPAELLDLVTAADHLTHAIREGQRILVWGDFDVDGMTSTALLIDALERLGANVKFYIPHRLRESHGIRLDSLQDQIARYQPHVLLTCDTGVSAMGEITYAREQGLTVLVTDHHDLPPELPPAHAVVNPKRLPPGHPLASLPGVGAAYKLIEYLYERHGEDEHTVDFLDLVALGIVADVAEQTHDTRYLLQIGLDRLRNTQRAGLRALIKVAGVEMGRLNATDIGFQLGPRMNAAGRLADAYPVVELLITQDVGRAQVLAAQLEGLNNQRRLQNRDIYAAAQEQIAGDPTLLDWEALVLASTTWHAGIIGIVASRLAEQYQRPVVLLTVSEDDNIARGSARSAPGYDIGAAVAAQADLLQHFGGHPGAAGMALHPDHIPAFRRRLSDTLREARDPSVRPGISLDAYLPLPDVTLELAGELNRLAPFGEGNPRITLATRELTLKSAAMIGRAQHHRRLTVQDAAGNEQKVLWWNSADEALPEGLFDIAYELEISAFRGETELQFTLVDYRRSPSAPVEVVHPQRTVTDLRGKPSPESIPAGYPAAVVWAEGYRRAESPGCTLDELSPAETLVIYTAPARPSLLQRALEKVEPQEVVLVGLDPPVHTFAEIQQRLLQLSKYVINRQDGQTTTVELAAATAQTHAIVRAGLDLLAARGEINVIYHGEDGVRITSNGTASDDVGDKHAVFYAEAAETAAYRALFQRADAYHLLGWEPPA